MPTIAAICSVSVLATVATLPVVGVAVAHPDSADVYAVFGAMIASILALIEARKKDRGLSHTISVFLGSASVGAFMPGMAFQFAAFRGWITHETAEAYLTWQFWAFAGLIAGLNGWAVLAWINARISQYKERNTPPEL